MRLWKFLSIIQLLSFSVHAVELKREFGRAEIEECDLNIDVREKVLALARADFYKEIDLTKYQQVSKFSEWTQRRTPMFMEQCGYIVHLGATVVPKDKIDEDWYYVANGFFDLPLHSTMDGWAGAIANAKMDADFYCGGKSEEPYKIEKEIVNNFFDQWNRYSARIFVKCIKPNNS